MANQEAVKLKETTFLSLGRLIQQTGIGMPERLQLLWWWKQREFGEAMEENVRLASKRSGKLSDEGERSVL